MRMRMVLIPPWVERALVASQKPLALALDAVLLSSILSKEDVAIYIDLNDRMTSKMFAPLAESFDTYYLHPLAVGSQQKIGYEKELEDYLINKINDLRLENPELPPVYILTDQVPLFSDSDGAVSLSDVMARYTFEAFYIKDDVIAIRPILMNTEESFIKQQVRAYDDLLKLLCLHLSLEQLAQLPVFNNYVRLLQAA